MEKFKMKNVVILPTNEKVNSLKGYKDLSLIFYFKNSYVNNGKSIEKELQHFHLYITSDEDIKDGDNNWVYYIPENIIILNDKYSQANLKDCKKVIATTDTSLGLPQPSQAFIDAYIIAYNAGTPITKVMVAYEDFMLNNGVNLNDGYHSKLKVDKSNAITIRKVKDQWNEAEVISLLRKAFDDSCKYTLFQDFINSELYNH